jgi:hypothetical protein
VFVCCLMMSSYPALNPSLALPPISHPHEENWSFRWFTAARTLPAVCALSISSNPSRATFTRSSPCILPSQRYFPRILHVFYVVNSYCHVLALVHGPLPSFDSRPCAQTRTMWKSPRIAAIHVTSRSKPRGGQGEEDYAAGCMPFLFRAEPGKAGVELVLRFNNLSRSVAARSRWTSKCATTRPAMMATATSM